MATLVDIVDRLCAWVDDNICQKVMLKAAPISEYEPDGAEYEYTRVKPACFPMYVPGTDKMPPKVKAPTPSVCVRIVGGEDGRSEGTVGIELWFSVWNPGTHGRDILKTVENNPLAYMEWTGDEAEAYYKRDMEGWRDIWNWIDIALREIESVASIDGLAIDRDKGIAFAPAKDEGGILDFYPYWFGYISFTLKRPIVRNVKEYDEML